MHFLNQNGLALAASLLSCPLTVHAIWNFKLYAYPISTTVNPSTDPQQTAQSSEWAPLKYKNFWRVCYQAYPGDPGDNRRFYDWVARNQIRLVYDGKSCGTGWRQDWTVIRQGLRNAVSRENYDSLVSRMFDRRDRFSYSLGDAYVHFNSYLLAMADVDPNDPVYGLFANEWPVNFPMVMGGSITESRTPYDRAPRFGTVRLDEYCMDAPPMGPGQEIANPIWFNTDLRMGQAAMLLPEYDEGIKTVDFYIDRNLSPDYDLVACGSNKQSYLNLKIVSRDTPYRGAGHCFKVQLTTSKNETEHMKDLWNMRQYLYRTAGIRFAARAPYKPSYGLSMRGVGEAPFFFRANDPSRTRIDDPANDQLLAQEFVWGDDRNQLPILDMMTDLQYPYPEYPITWKEDQYPTRFGNQYEESEDSDDDDVDYEQYGIYPYRPNALYARVDDVRTPSDDINRYEQPEQIDVFGLHDGHPDAYEIRPRREEEDDSDNEDDYDRPRKQVDNRRKYDSWQG